MNVDLNIFITVTCPMPLQVANTVNNPTEPVSYPDSVTYTCNPGYTHVSGDLTRNCQPDGTWSGIPPVCQGRLISLF